MNVAGMLKAKGRAVTTAKPETTLLEISTKLAAKRIGAIIVVAEGGRIAGIISERDVIRTVAERGAAAPRSATVRITSRSEMMPAMRPPSATTMMAPIRLAASFVDISSSVVSGFAVVTARPLALSIPATFIAIFSA